MMMGRGGSFGLLARAAVGTLLLLPAPGSTQDSLAVSCADVEYLTPLQDLIRCAEQGMAAAQFFLGAQHDRGEGVPWNILEAVRLYRLAAEQGNDFAQLRLGYLYANGTGVAEDDAEAARLYRLAAEQGNPTAGLFLGEMYSKGDGVPEDHAEAVRWYRLAAEKGNASAQAYLGFRYAVGEGVPRDLVYAYMWLEISAARGNERARGGQQVIVEEMTREQIAEAEKLSRDWLESHSRDGGN